MSAAEKLRALGERANDALEELSGDAGWAHAYQPGGEDAPDREPDVRAILAALPAIIAVVEAAELVVSDFDIVYGPIVAALATLSQALEPGEKT